MAHSSWRSAVVGLAAVGAATLLFQDGVRAQGRGRGAVEQRTPKAAAPFDVTGYWVAEISEDWRWRMVTPAKGDWESLPMTKEAQTVADAWDPKKDEARGEQCKSYGAPALMRTPTRLNITWQDDNTLSVQTDYGMQTRLLHFGNWKAPAGPPTWQGDSVARWEAPGGRGNVHPGVGSLVVVTSHVRPGYLRKNGVPYSANATLTETWDVIKEANGDQRILMLLQVDDLMYLNGPYVTPVHFKKEPNGAKWDPSPCSSTW